MVKIPNTEWRLVLIDDAPTIKFKCPKCKVEQQIDHEINDFGVLSPSVLCGDECGFHDTVFLEDYKK